MLADINGGRLELSANAVQPDRAIDMSSRKISKRSFCRRNRGNRSQRHHYRGSLGPSTGASNFSGQPPGGRVSFFGGLPKDKPVIQLDSNVVHYKELILGGANGSSPAQNKEALELIASGAVPGC